MTDIYTLIEDNALFFQEISGLNSDELINALLGVVAFLFVIIVLSFLSGRGRKRSIRRLQEGREEVEKKKGAVAQNLETYKNQNKKLRDEIVRLKNEFVAERRRIKQKELSLDEKGTELEKGLLKVKILEETVNMHRTKIGILEKKKHELASELEASSSNLDEQLKAEREKHEAKIEELKNETKERMSAFFDPMEETINMYKTKVGDLEKENRELTSKLEASSADMDEQLKAEKESYEARMGTLEKEKQELTSKLEGSSAGLDAQVKAEKEKYEAKIMELKKETKEKMRTFSERKEAELAGLKKENEELKRELGQL